jgi:UDP-glucose 4-epimerase
MSDERIAVTGGTGFIGSQVVSSLLSSGKQVRVLSRAGRAHPDADAFRCDISKRESIAGAFVGCNAVLHFAAQIPNANVSDRLFAKVNVEGTRNVVEEALKCGVRRVIMASTWCVYGTPKYLPINEAHPTVPNDAYGSSKLAAENILHECCEAHGAAHCVLRYSNVYGPEASQHGAILRFIESVAAGQPPVVFGDGSQVVDYVYVSDAAEAALLALSCAASGDRKSVV